MEKYFLCFPRANDYLTNITIVTWLFLILFQITNETLPHFQDEMFLLVIPETEKILPFFYNKNSPFLITEVAVLISFFSFSQL